MIKIIYVELEFTTILEAIIPFESFKYTCATLPVDKSNF